MPFPWMAAAIIGAPVVSHFLGGNKKYKTPGYVKDYYRTAQGILNDPSAFEMDAGMQQDYMAAVRNQAMRSMDQSMAGFDRWAAQRGVSGGAQINQRIKLAQELGRNMVNARAHMNDLNFNARNQARLAALGAMGRASGQMNQASQFGYNAQMQQDLMSEQVWGQLLGQGAMYLDDWMQNRNSGRDYSSGQPYPGVGVQIGSTRRFGD